MTDSLDGIAMFAAVAEAKGFRAAGARLGVSGSAVSQALRRLEQQLGVALVQRTTRSVRLTAECNYHLEDAHNSSTESGDSGKKEA